MLDKWIDLTLPVYGQMCNTLKSAAVERIAGLMNIIRGAFKVWGKQIYILCTSNCMVISRYDSYGQLIVHVLI